MNASSQDLQREARDLVQSLTTAYADTPLVEVGIRLKELIEGVAAAVSSGGSDAPLVQVSISVVSVQSVSN
jgi:hypothetical protein